MEARKMREILFRGKRVDNGEWIEGWYGKQSFGAWPLRDAITHCADAENGYLHYEEVIPDTVGQYTGLKANGKRIFEGDILRDVITTNGEVVTGVVSYADGAFGVKSKRCAYFLVFFENGEIIGNIHDNPELIGGNANEVP